MLNKNQNINKKLTFKDLELYYSLEEKIKKEANDLLRWYDKDVNCVMNVDDLSYDCIEGDRIFYDGYICHETIGITLETDLLFLSDKERVKYAKKFKDDLAEELRLKAEKQHEQDQQRKIDLENYERKELERLKEKYEL